METTKRILDFPCACNTRHASVNTKPLGLTAIAVRFRKKGYVEFDICAECENLDCKERPITRLPTVASRRSKSWQILKAKSCGCRTPRVLLKFLDFKFHATDGAKTVSSAFKSEIEKCGICREKMITSHPSCYLNCKRCETHL